MKQQFILKFKASKIDNTEKLVLQVGRVVEIIQNRYSFNNKKVYLFIGTVDDDFIKGIKRLRIKFI